MRAPMDLCGRAVLRLDAGSVVKQQHYTAAKESAVSEPLLDSGSSDGRMTC